MHFSILIIFLIYLVLFKLSKINVSLHETHLQVHIKKWKGPKMFLLLETCDEILCTNKSLNPPLNTHTNHNHRHKNTHTYWKRGLYPRLVDPQLQIHDKAGRSSVWTVVSPLGRVYTGRCAPDIKTKKKKKKKKRCKVSKVPGVDSSNMML